MCMRWEGGGGWRGGRGGLLTTQFGAGKVAACDWDEEPVAAPTVTDADGGLFGCDDGHEVVQFGWFWVR